MGTARRAITLTLGTALILGGPVAAHAAQGNPGTPPSQAPPLLGTQYGTTTLNDVSTAPASGSSGYISECGQSGTLTTGAAAYRLDLAAGTLIDLTVWDDHANTQSLCAVELVAAEKGGSSLTTLYDRAHRETFLATRSFCTSTASVCEEHWRAAEAGTYYLVFWPAGGGDPGTAEFDALARVRQPSATMLQLRGYADRPGACFRVSKGSSFSASTLTTPASASGAMLLRLRRKNVSTGVWSVVREQLVDLSNGATKLTYAGLGFGRYNVRAHYGGDDVVAPSSSQGLCIDVVTPSTVLQGVSGNYAMSHDYFVYRSGRTITITTKVGPAPAGGLVRYRLERQKPNGAYEPAATWTRRVTNSRAILEFSLPYRSNSRYYRLRSEYSGDGGHLAAKSAWNCVEIRR